MTAHKLQIIPGPGGINPHGTKVLLDGVEVKALRKLVLSAEVGGTWRATLNLNVELIEVTVMTDVKPVYAEMERPDLPAL